MPDPMTVEVPVDLVADALGVCTSELQDMREYGGDGPWTDHVAHVVDELDAVLTEVDDE